MGYNEYYEEDLKKRMKTVEEEIAKRKTEDAAQKEQINATLGTAADAAAGVYRQGIEDAPLESRALYDQNAMREAIDRKQIQESLSNMGMTDSGPSSSMQTALTVQKSRADNQVRADEQARIREMESAIDQIYANMELEKASQGLAIDQATTEWEREQRLDAESEAAQTATSRYNADVQAAADKYVADVKAQSEASKLAVEAEQKWLQQQLSGQQDTAKLRNDYVKLLMTRENNPLDSITAWQEAYRAYPDTPVMSQAQYGYYTHYLNSGYSSEYANAMAKAYMNTAAAGGTEEQVSEAVSNALAEQARKMAQKRGADRDVTAWSNDAAGVKRSMAETLQSIEGIEMSDAERMEIVAYLVGTAYSYHVRKSTDTKIYQQIGEALAANLSGIYLEIALACAGLQ